MPLHANRIVVTDFEDSRLVAYQNLKDGTLARRHGRFIVEGRGNLEVLLERSTFRPESILLSQRVERAIGDRLDRLAPDCPIYVAEQEILDRVVGFSIHRGCVAACVRPKSVDALELAERLVRESSRPCLLVLESLRDHDNVGGIFRNAMALGGSGVILCPETCDPLYRKAIRTSMGGSLCLPFARADAWPSTLNALRDLGYEVWALDPAKESVDIDALVRQRGARAAAPIALLLGTERDGLSEGALAAADQRVRIDMEDRVDSLNVAVAAGIALHTLRR